MNQNKPLVVTVTSHNLDFPRDQRNISRPLKVYLPGTCDISKFTCTQKHGPQSETKQNYKPARRLGKVMIAVGNFNTSLIDRADEHRHTHTHACAHTQAHPGRI